MTPELQKIINDLTTRIADLENNQISINMPYDKREALRDQIIEKKIILTTEVISGLLIFNWKDVQYKVPFYI